MEKFPTLFGNILEDAKKHSIEFNNACDIHDVVEDEVACWLFILTLQGNACEWLYSLLPKTIINWAVLESLFIEIYFPRCYREIWHQWKSKDPKWLNKGIPHLSPSWKYVKIHFFYLNTLFVKK